MKSLKKARKVARQKTITTVVCENGFFIKWVKKKLNIEKKPVFIVLDRDYKKIAIFPYQNSYLTIKNSRKL